MSPQLNKAQRALEKLTYLFSSAMLPRHEGPRRLTIGLVPRQLWRENLRADHRIGRYYWTQLRKRLLQNQGADCVICGSDYKPNAHEVWEYKEGKRVGRATLLGIEFICLRCHQVHHFGRTEQLFDQGYVTIREMRLIRRHYAVLNECRPHDLRKHYQAAFEAWQRRNELRWHFEYGRYSNWVYQIQGYRTYVKRTRLGLPVSPNGMYLLSGE